MRLKHCWVVGCFSALLLMGSRAQDTVRVRLVFPGVSQSAFDSISSKVADTVATVAGVPTYYVTQVGSAAISANVSAAVSTTGRPQAPANTGEAVLESAPSQLPSPMATAPGYIRAQYYSSLNSSSSGRSSGSTVDSGVDSAAPKTIYTPFVKPADKKVRAHRPSITSADSARGGSNSSRLNGIGSDSRIVAGTTPDNIAPSSAAASATGRQLLAVESAAVEYAIKSNASAGPWADSGVIRRKVMASAAGFGQASAAGFGKGFYAALEKNGVQYQPTVYLDGTQILAGGLTSDAPKSKFGTRHEDGPKFFDPTDLANKTGVVQLGAVQPTVLLKDAAPGQTHMAAWVIGVIVAVGVLVVAFGGVVAWRCSKRYSKDKTPDDASQGSSQNQFIADDGSTEV